MTNTPNLSRGISRYLFPNIGTLVIMALMLFAYDAWAASAQEPQSPASPDAVPGVIAYQGTLVDATQQPVNGTVDITFRFYDDATDGNLLWEEPQTIPISGGLFNANLGSVVPIPYYSMGI